MCDRIHQWINLVLNFCFFMTDSISLLLISLFRFSIFSFFQDFIYLFETEHESANRGGEGGQREKWTLYWAGSLLWSSIWGPWDRDLNWRQMLNLMSHPCTPVFLFFLNSVSDDGIFLGICPFLVDCWICWCIIVQNSLLRFFVFHRYQL